MTERHVVVGNRVHPMPELAEGDKLIAVQATGDLLVVPAAEHALAAEAVARANGAFAQMSATSDEQISDFFRAFADRLSDDVVWKSVADANASDVERAKAAGRSTTRLVASVTMRDAMIEGLIGWSKAPSRRGELIERRDGQGWHVERRRAPLGVVAFVFEG